MPSGPSGQEGDDGNDDANSARRRLLRAALLDAIAPMMIPAESLDEAIADYLVAMLLETDGDDAADRGDAYDDEAAREILMGYLPATELGDDDSLDVAGLRRRLRQIEAASREAAERELREEQRRRALAASSALSGSLAEAAAAAAAAAASLEAGAEAAAGAEAPPDDDENDDDEEAHAEALAFLGQLLPDAGSDVVAYAFRVKCLRDRARAADLLLGLAGDAAAVAALAAEMERHEAARREAREAARRAQAAAEAAAKQAVIDRFADQVVIPGGASSSGAAAFSSSSSSSSARKKGPAAAPIPLPAPPPDSRLRYHNGQPLHLPKGNQTGNYIVEKITPDWDGGSRGKVKTKGKRGPGFV